MKVAGIVAFLASLFCARAESCTHGRLFIADADSTTIRVFDLSNLDSLTVTNSLTVPGKAGVNLAASGSNEEVAAMFRGTESLGYTDGVVSFIDAGVSTEEHGDHADVVTKDPTLIANAGFECARAIHFVPHDSKIAIFCDGSYTADPQVNSTVWVIDETKFGSTTESAVVFSATLEGSHHGVAIPVDDNHVLYSLATADRINRVPNATSLPATFQVVDYQGNILHSIADESSPDTSCSGFHGSSAIDGKFALACDAEHGGILVVNYQADSSSYTSRALQYPASFPEHRTGSFLEHPNAEYIIGNFAGKDKYHLMAFKSTDTAVADDQVLTLPARQCAFVYDMSSAEDVIVLMPTGVVHVFEFHEGQWKEITKLDVVLGMTDCSEAMLVAGFGQAFVLVMESKKIHALDLKDHNDIVVKSTQIDFTPFSAVVSGVPDEVACGSGRDGHDHSSALFLSTNVVSTVVMVALALLMG